MLLKKTFGIDINKCPACCAPIKARSRKAVTAPDLIESILRAMGINHHPPPIKPAKYRTDSFDFDQRTADEGF